MTGEVTLNGRVLPIGGVKQKLLAAQRAGLTEVYLPARNEPDLDDVPADVLVRRDGAPGLRRARDPRQRARIRQSLPCRRRVWRRDRPNDPDAATDAAAVAVGRRRGGAGRLRTVRASRSG